MRFTRVVTRKIILLLLLVPFMILAQQKTGNIVEYFGKEKVNDIKEGKLLHVFKTGLALKIQNFNFNSSSFPKDQVFSKFLNEPDYKPVSNATFDVDFLGNEQKWLPVTANEKNSFNDGNLRSSYVYLSYHSGSSKTVLFEASGHSLVLINGMPHEGDHYDFGWNLIPLKLKKGLNKFVLKVGRFPRIRARLIEPKPKVQFTTRDLTFPDILTEEDKTYFGSIRIVNATENWVKGYAITSKLHDKELTHNIPNIPPMSVRKVPFKIASITDAAKTGKASLELKLVNRKGQTVNAITTNIQIRSKHDHHKRTLISNVDGSVQYYSVAPSLDKETSSQAMFLSVHGASVEAVNQANAYKKKDWGNLIAPTNRRPFGFAWEDWGRLDALEVLADAKSIYNPDNKKVYLTGHSMGGHGTWYLGATYPDHFAAIAPCAGYPDLLRYRDGFFNRIKTMPKAQLSRFGITPKMLDRMKDKPEPTAVENMIYRAGTPSRTLELIRNYLHHGIYLLHGEKDNVVPTYIARDMRERLGKFHPDFTYYEYPDGTHWYGNHSVDWEPIFDLFKRRTIKDDKDIKKLEFFTGSPGVSSRSHFIAIHQQEKPFKTSSFNFSKEKDKAVLKTNNVELLEIDYTEVKTTENTIEIDGTQLQVVDGKKNYFQKKEGEWHQSDAPDVSDKGPHRNGGFKDAFNNNVVLVYATKGTKAENEWYYNRARFDAETFWYRANGNIDVVRDVDFSLKKYVDKNVVVYGNKDNNSAWHLLLKDSPIQVRNSQVDFNGKLLSGKQWGMYFIVPRKDSDNASVGVVTATGNKGMKAAYMNHYLVNGTTFPDVLLFDYSVLVNGISEVKCAGFFGNNWSVETGDFEWK